jgi:hypothetical protein
MTVSEYLAAHPHAAAWAVCRSKTRVAETTELIGRQITKLSLEFLTTIRRQTLETPIGILKPIACIRRQAPKGLIAVTYRATLIVTEIFPLPKTVLRLSLLLPIHLKPTRCTSRNLLLPRGVHLLPTVSVFGQNSSLPVRQIIPSYAIRIGNPNECKRTCYQYDELKFRSHRPSSARLHARHP